MQRESMPCTDTDMPAKQDSHSRLLGNLHACRPVFAIVQAIADARHRLPSYDQSSKKARRMVEQVRVEAQVMWPAWTECLSAQTSTQKI